MVVKNIEEGLPPKYVCVCVCVCVCVHSPMFSVIYIFRETKKF